MEIAAHLPGTKMIIHIQSKKDRYGRIGPQIRDQICEMPMWIAPEYFFFAHIFAPMFRRLAGIRNAY